MEKEYLYLTFKPDVANNLAIEFLAKVDTHIVDSLIYCTQTDTPINRNITKLISLKKIKATTNKISRFHNVMNIIGICILISIAYIFSTSIDTSFMFGVFIAITLMILSIFYLISISIYTRFAYAKLLMFNHEKVLKLLTTVIACVPYKDFIQNNLIIPNFTTFENYELFDHPVYAILHKNKKMLHNYTNLADMFNITLNLRKEQDEYLVYTKVIIKDDENIDIEFITSDQLSQLKRDDV